MRRKYFVAHICLIVQLTIPLVLQAALTGSSEELLDSGDNSTRRPRRMIWATPLTDTHAPFKSPKWFVYLAYGNGWSTFLMKFYRQFGWKFIGEPYVSPFNGNCGGSLLTPKVVGSACHCFHHEASVNFTFVRYLPWNSWESYLAVYHGYYTKQDMEANPLLGSWAWSKRFVVHQQCGKINVQQKRPGKGKVIYDYGLIMLTREMQFTKPGTTLVPMYLPDDIIRNYNIVQRKESICLAIGFGKYNWEAPEVPGDASPVLMHGWRNIQNYEFCNGNLAGNVYFSGFVKALGYDPTYVQTSMCHLPFGKIRSTTMPGDSGGPITCDNVYVGLNSFGTRLDFLPGDGRKRPSRLISFAAAIAFAIEWHSANHRADMLKYLEEYAQTPELYTTVNTFKPWVGKYRDVGTSSNSSPKMSTSRMASALAVLSILNILQYEM